MEKHTLMLKRKNLQINKKEMNLFEKEKKNQLVT